MNISSVHPQEITKNNDNNANCEIYNNYTIESFSLNGIYTSCRVLDIYDIDTVIVAIKYNSIIYKITVKLVDVQINETSTIENIYKLRQNVVNMLLYDNNIDLTVDKYISRKNIVDILSNNICVLNLYCSDYDTNGNIMGRLYSNNSAYETKIESYNNIIMNNLYRIK
jgi:hypothetical protein